MARLEELTPGAFVKGLLPDRLVTVVNLKWYGSTGVELTFKDAAGRPDSVLLYRDHEPALEIVSVVRPWSFDADGEVLRLVSEAYRIHLAYSIDGQSAHSFVETSRVHGRDFDGAILNQKFVKEQLLLEERTLAREAIVTARDQETWGTKQGAGIRGVEAFFVEAINLLDGQICVREPGRYEITQLPASLADLGGSSGFDKQDLKRYNYFTFDAEKVSLPNKPPAELISPGHPLIQATVQLVLEHYQDVLRQGAILVDPGDDGEEVRVLFYLEHLVEEVGDAAARNGVISRQLQCVSIDLHGQVQMAGKAPHLNYQPLGADDVGLLDALRDEHWIRDGLEDKALEYAVSEIVPRHLEQVRHRQKELTARAMATVKNRVREELKVEKDTAGQRDLQGPAVNPSMDEFESQLQQHMQDLEQKRQIFPLPPVAVGGALVVPAGLLAQLKSRHQGGIEEIIVGAEPESTDIENVIAPPQVSVPQNNIETWLPEVGEPVQEEATKPEGPSPHVAKVSGTEIQWREIIEHIQQDEHQEHQEHQEEPLPVEEYQRSDESALFSLIPDLVQSQDPGAGFRERETAGSRPYGLGKKHLTGIPVDLQEEWQAHALRLQELGQEVPQDVPLVKTQRYRWRSCCVDTTEQVADGI